MRVILIIDNDVAVDIFYELRQTNISIFKKVIDHLKSEYSHLWIPKEVEKEFCNHGQFGKKRKKVISEIKKDSEFIMTCPITVSKWEIDFDNEYSGEDKGETDAMLQAAKASGVKDKRYDFSEVHLFFKDKIAIKRAESKNLKILKYKDFANKLKEAGIILPA